MLNIVSIFLIIVNVWFALAEFAVWPMFNMFVAGMLLGQLIHAFIVDDF